MITERIELGRTGLEVSPVGFGGIPITRLDPDDAVARVREAIDAGINFIDTASGYPDSEPRIGRAIEPYDRESLVVATKDPSTDGKAFAEKVHRSLERLGVEYLDIMQFHNVADEENWEAVRAPGGALEAARRLRDEGLVRHIGVTSHSIDLSAEMIDSGAFDTLQVPLNFIADEGVFLVEKCRNLGVGLIVMKPFAGGAIDDGELALRFLQQFPSAVPIPGIETREELRQVIELYESPAQPTDDQLKRMVELKREIGKVFCRGCGYCLPCPQEIPIPMLLRAESLARRLPVERARRALSRHMPKAEQCENCRLCVERCPYDLEVPDMLREVQAWYEGWLAEQV